MTATILLLLVKKVIILKDSPQNERGSLKLVVIEIEISLVASLHAKLVDFRLASNKYTLLNI